LIKEAYDLLRDEDYKSGFTEDTLKGMMKELLQKLLKFTCRH